MLHAMLRQPCVTQVHVIRDNVFQAVPPEEGSSWFRGQPWESTWPLHLFVPLAGGLTVGILNAVSAGLAELPPPRLFASPREADYNNAPLNNANSGIPAPAWMSEDSLWEKFLGTVRPLLKAVAAAVTLGTGNSLGPEGPSVEIGSAWGRGGGSVVGGGRERTIALVAAGSAAGISAGE